MPKVGIVYFTKTDITGQLVKAASSEIESKGLDVYEHLIEGGELIEGRFVNDKVFDELRNCEAIIFASPTYMGGVAAQFKAFADATSDFWEAQEWADKIAAGITSGSAFNGDQSSTIQYFSILASQHGMYWVGLDSANSNDSINRLGCQLGVVAQSNDGIVNQLDLNTAKYLGARVSNLVLNMQK
ncbi:flavodoxin family protein [Thalassotalea aquiviva]|uniref:flavodoxin family protein n=1 Tax=Thalassotalea aquiviva TaxID=3242415 RepID=UPI00352B91EF